MEPHEVRPFYYVHDILGPGGWFERRVPGYKSREEQVRLAEAFANYLLLSDHRTGRHRPFVAEAPCGTGKTYAYLVPLLYHHAHLAVDGGSYLQKIFLSTGGIALQEQLVAKDIPAVLELIKPLLEKAGVSHVSVTTLKGTSNYLCAAEVEQNEEEIARLMGASFLDELRSGEDWGSRDLSSNPPRDPKVLPLITVESDSCKKSKCRFAESCGYMRAKQKAFGEVPRKELRIIVTNHHALVAHRHSLVDHGFRSLVDHGFVLLDEAHELPDIYRDMLTKKINQKSWRRLIDRAIKEWSKEENSEDKIEDLAALADLDVFSGIRVPELLPGQIRDATNLEYTSEPGSVPLLSVTKLYRLMPPSTTFREKVDSLSRVFTPRESDDHVYRVWAKDDEGEISLLETQKELKNLANAHFSATLRYKGSFESYLRKNSIYGAYRFTAKSPFDWESQCLVVFPKKYAHLNPSKGDRGDYLKALSSAAQEITSLSKGRCMMICSSWQSARYVAERLRATQPYRVLLQGDTGKQQLVAHFTEDVSSILVGTLSFWTGVDVPGEALSTLIIDKIPFQGGMDVYTEILKERKENWFDGHVLMKATTTLAQGFGRLIRSVQDRGVCVVLDPRIFPYGKNKAHYARTVLNTVFPETCNFSDDLLDIERFLGTLPIGTWRRASPPFSSYPVCMKDLQVVHAQSYVPISQAQVIPGMTPETLRIVGGPFDAVEEVLVGGVPSPSIFLESSTVLLAQVPEDVRGTNYDVEVLSPLLFLSQKALYRFRLGKQPVFVQGLPRLLQTFVWTLLQTPGSSILNPELGGGLLDTLRSVVSGPEIKALASAAYLSVQKTVNDIIFAQARDPSLSMEERLATAEVIGCGPFQDRLYLDLAVMNQAGKRARSSIQL